MPSNASAVESAPSPASLRRLPARPTEPPFDDDEHGEPAGRCDAVQGTLALAFALPSGLPVVPGMPSASPEKPRRRLALVPSPAPLDDVSTGALRRPGRRDRAGRAFDIDDFGPQHTAREFLPDPRLWAARLVQAIVEVTVGARPVGQLIRWTSTNVYESVQRRVNHAGSVLGAERRAAAIVRSVHVSEPSDGVAEVCAVVQHGARCRALALRLEGVDGRWQCTALQVC